MKRRSIILVALASFLALGGATSPASGTARRSHAAAQTVIPTTAIAGYQQVVGRLRSDLRLHKTYGSVRCPNGTQVIGGGVTFTGTRLEENLGASYPAVDPLSWQVRVSNAARTDGSYRIHAICVTRVIAYSVVAGPSASVPDGQVGTAAAACPPQTVPLGGGGWDFSFSTRANLASSIPTMRGWRAGVGNRSGAEDAALAYAACGRKPAGYVQVAGAPTAIGAMGEGTATASCPAGTVVLGGGGGTASAAPGVWLHSSAPSGRSGWTVTVNDTTADATTATAYAVCARPAA